jgi:hypothetical protein
VHGAAFVVRLGFVVQRDLQQCPQGRIGRGAEVVQKLLGGCRPRPGQFIDESM